MPSPQQPPAYSGTILETDDENLQPVQVGKSWWPATAPPSPLAAAAGIVLPPLNQQAPAAPPKPKPAPSPTPPATPAAANFRPTHRLPIAVLVVCDDGRTDGELIRLRADQFVIGRTEGDLLIPHDDLISSRHAEITRQQTGGGCRWVVTDLQSTNGLFVRVSKALLADRAEFLVGSGRYRFEAATTPGGTLDYQPDDARGSTRGWEAESAAFMPPALVELVPGGIGNRYVLNRAEYWIGTDPICPIGRPDDPFCEALHARLWRLPDGAWQIEHKKTVNGVWLRVPQIATEKGCVFQIGEQRFRIAVEGKA